MFKSIRPFTVLTALVLIMVPVLAACSSNQAARLTSTPTTVAASPVAVQATPTTAAATPTTAAATATPIAAKPTATTAVTPTVEVKPTATLPKATPAALKPAATPPAMTEAFVARMASDKTLGDILTDAKGMTLYTFKNDKPNESTCDAACANTWPPVVVENEQVKLAPASGIDGKFGVIERKDGAYQVTYNEMPLYRYSEDSMPGEAMGENLKDLWHVVSLGETGMGQSTPDKAEAMSAGGKIALLLPGDSADRPYFEAKLKELCPDCQLIYSSANQNAKTQLTQAEAALSGGAQILVLDPVDPAGAALIADKARAQDVPVIAYNRLIMNSAGVNYYVTFDNRKVGELQAQSLVDELNKLGDKDPQIIMINGSLTDNADRLFKEGAQSVFDPLVKAKKLTIAKEFNLTDTNLEQVRNEMQQTLTALGNKVNGVYAVNDNIAGSVIAAMKAAGLKTIPPVTGQDAELAAVQRILDGEQFMTVYKAIKPEAEQAAQLAYDLLTRADIPTSMTEGNTVNNGKMDVPAVLLAPVAVTKSNINDTIIKDNFWNVSQICTTEYAKACTEAGLK